MWAWRSGVWKTQTSGHLEKEQTTQFSQSQQRSAGGQTSSLLGRNTVIWKYTGEDLASQTVLLAHSHPTMSYQYLLMPHKCLTNALLWNACPTTLVPRLLPTVVHRLLFHFCCKRWGLVLVLLMCQWALSLWGLWLWMLDLGTFGFSPCAPWQQSMLRQCYLFSWPPIH